VNRPVERERERGVEAPAIEGTAPAAAPRASALLALQRSAGNQAVARALMQRAPKDPPEGVSLPADPLPAGANVADPDAARIVADPSLPGGWNDKSGNSRNALASQIDQACARCSKIGSGAPPLPGRRTNAIRFPSGDQRGLESRDVDGSR